VTVSQKSFYKYICTVAQLKCSCTCNISCNAYLKLMEYYSAFTVLLKNYLNPWIKASWWMLHILSARSPPCDFVESSQACRQITQLYSHNKTNEMH